MQPTPSRLRNVWSGAPKASPSLIVRLYFFCVNSFSILDVRRLGPFPPKNSETRCAATGFLCLVSLTFPYKGKSLGNARSPIYHTVCHRIKTPSDFDQTAFFKYLRLVGLRYCRPAPISLLQCRHSQNATLRNPFYRMPKSQCFHTTQYSRQ